MASLYKKPKSGIGMNLKDYDKIFFLQILMQRRNTIIYESDAIASCGWSLKINMKIKIIN
jgi:hypothetical protein